MSEQTSPQNESSKLKDARRRALRAAQAVALAGSLALGLGACGARSTPKPDTRGGQTDTIVVRNDQRVVRLDAGVKKDVTVDSNPCNNGCGTPGCPCVGPFVPPEMPA